MIAAVLEESLKFWTNLRFGSGHTGFNVGSCVLPFRIGFDVVFVVF